MAQTGYTPILIYSSSTTTNAPSAGNLTNSTLGSELAINIADGKLFYKDNANAVQVIGWKTTPTTAGGTGLTSYTAGDLLYYATGTTLTKLAIGSAYQALQVNAGGTAPSWQASATSTLTTQGDLLYASAANTLARLAKNTTATRYLANTGSSNNPAWDQVNLANGVTGTLPAANGGTGIASYTANRILYASAATTISTSAGLTFDGTNFKTTGGATQTGYAIYDASGQVTSFANGATFTITLPAPFTAGIFCLELEDATNGNRNNRQIWFASNRYGSAPQITSLASHNGSTAGVSYSVSTSSSSNNQTITITNSQGQNMSGYWAYTGLAV